MLIIFPYAEPRPDSLIPENEKEKDYHLKMGRYCISAGFNYLHQNFLEKCQINRRFYVNDQWVFDDDIETFLKDEPGTERNRLKITKNVIRPMVEGYRGNAIRMSINFAAKAISSKAVNRREEKLSEMLFYTDMANESAYGDVLRQNLPIGKDRTQTKQFFGDLYEDDYEAAMNYLIDYIERYNKLPQKQMPIALDLALDGIAVVKDRTYNNHQIFEHIHSQNYFFDRSGLNQDLSDTMFQGDVAQLTPEDIYEQYSVEDETIRSAIMNYAIAWGTYLTSSQVVNQVGYINVGGRIPVYTVYWKDTCKYEMAYVNDKFGYPYFTRVNYTYPGEEKPRYTDQDIIEVKNETAEKLLKGRKKTVRYMQKVRYAVIVPQEIFGYASTEFKEKNQGKNIGDIVLDYGVMPYQENDCYDWTQVKLPYKVFTWAYVDGQVQSPVDDAIDPQRFINRLFSISENQINNSRGSGTIIDSSMVDPDGGQEEVERRMNNSQPIFVDGRGRSIQNSVFQYDGTVKQGTMVLFNIMDVAQKFVQDVTGINEAMKGESTGSDQLVGVTRTMLQQGSLMQEPFYYAMVEIYRQIYESMASRGKRIYADSGRELPVMVGDKYAKMLRITKDIAAETFRIFVERKNSDEMMIQAGNQILLVFLQMGLINQDQYADLYDRSTPSQVSAAIRRFAAEKRVATILNAEREQQAMGQMMMQAQVEQQQAKAEQEGQIQGALAANEAQQQQQNKAKIQQQYAKGLTDLAKAGQISPDQFKMDMKQL